MAAVWRVPAVRTLVGVVGSQYILVGALDVLYVVLAITTLGMGESGAGYLNAAFGAGGVIGVAVTAALVARRRLAPALIAGIVTAALALGLLGLFPTVAGAFVLLAVAGVSRSVFDVTGRILLQRAAPPQVLGQVFALLESLMCIGLAFGAIFVPALVGLSGAPAALIGTAVLLLVIVAVVWKRLRSIDGAADVPQVQIQLLRLVPIFAPLPAPELEGLARALEPVHVAAGTTVIREGEAGDRFYAIATGRAAGDQERPRREDAAPRRRLRRDRPHRGRAAHGDGHGDDRRRALLADQGAVHPRPDRARTGGPRGQRHGLAAAGRARGAVAADTDDRLPLLRLRGPRRLRLLPQVRDGAGRTASPSPRSARSSPPSSATSSPSPR